MFLNVGPVGSQLGCSLPLWDDTFFGCRVHAPVLHQFIVALKRLGSAPTVNSLSDPYVTAYVVRLFFHLCQAGQCDRGVIDLRECFRSPRRRQSQVYFHN